MCKQNQKFFNEHYGNYYFNLLNNELLKIEKIIKEINGTNNESNFSKLSSQLENLQLSVHNIDKSGRNFITERTNLQNNTTELCNKTQKVVDHLKTQHKDKESQDLQMDISFMYSYLFRIINATDDISLQRVKVLVDELSIKINEKIQSANVI